MPNLKDRFKTWLSGLLGNAKTLAPHVSNSEACIQIAHAVNQSLVPYDEKLLERSRTQWQFGDWESLVMLGRDALQHHPERAKLALLAAAGHLQLGNGHAARQFTRLAQDWGCNKKLISQVLVSGVHNTLGRAAIVSEKQSIAMRHFELAIQLGGIGDESRLLTQARSRHQREQLGFNFGVTVDATSSVSETNFQGKPNRRQTSAIDGGYETALRGNHFLSNQRGESELSTLFEEIYKQKKWGSEEGWEYFSGSGSHDTNTVAQYVNALTTFFGRSAQSMSVVDIGCGDFNVGSLICGLFNEYTGIDIVAKLIDHNKERHKAPHVRFMCLDATRDIIPSGDIAIVRQVLQHLGNEDIFRFLRNVRGQFKYMLVVEHVPMGSDWVRNLDRPANSSIRLEINSGIEIESPPFNFPYHRKLIIAETEEFGGVIRTCVYVL